MRQAFVFAVMCAVFAAVACSSSNSTPCNQNPWECPTGQTCWPNSPTSFACLNSGSGQIGSPCQNTEGIATCGDGLACLTDESNGSGTCTPYCSNTNPAHACTGGAFCATATLVGSGATFQVCANSVVDSGTGSSSSSGDAQSPADSGSSAASSTADSGAADTGADTSTPDSGFVDASGLLGI